MYWIYAVCAAIGGTVLVCQFIMTLLGMSDIDNVDVATDLADDMPGSQGHHGTTWLFGVISFRTIVAALAFFGVTGLAGLSGGLTPPGTAVISIAAGLSAMYLVHWVMLTLHRLRAEGTVRIERAVGMPGTVYLRIPAARAGTGKVTVSLRDREMEFLAITASDALPTGAKVVVTGIVGADTVEVQAASETQELRHA